MSQTEFLATAGRRLTEAQLNRRRFMQGLAASGSFAAIAGLQRPMRAFAQATPSTEDWVPYNGPLADEQVMRLPTQEPATMDPGVSTGLDELNILFNIFDGLLGKDQRTGEIVPRVAERYEVSTDASEYTFYLRKDVVWSDGTPITAHDFEWSWKRVLDPNTASEYTDAMSIIKNGAKIAESGTGLDDLGVQAVDDYTLKVTLEGPSAFFPLLVATWTFYPVPKHVIDAKSNEWVEPGNIVSNGPFIMTEWSHNQKIVLEQNPTYYGEKPTLTRAEYLVYEDTGAQSYVAFENDELDYAAPEGPDLDRVLADPTLSQELLTLQRSNCYFVVCDTTNAPTDKVEFRQALSKSLDRKTLAETVLTNQYDSAPTLLPNDIPGHNPDAGIGENVDEAKQLVATAGVDPSSTELELVFINSAFQTTVAQYLQATWQKNLGITITLSPIEEATYTDWRASRETQPFNVYIGSWGSDFADPSNWLNQNFTHAADHYRNHWNDPEFDDLVGKALTNTNIDERNQQYAQAEAMLLEQAPIIPLVHEKGFRVVHPWVKDLFLQPQLSSVHLRTIKIAAH